MFKVWFKSINTQSYFNLVYAFIFHHAMNTVSKTHQEEAGADKLPAEPPVPAWSLANHLLNIITETIHP